jgi:hypothetical protein
VTLIDRRVTSRNNSYSVFTVYVISPKNFLCDLAKALEQSSSSVTILSTMSYIFTIYYNANKIPPVIHILCSNYLDYTFPRYIFKINFNLISVLQDLKSSLHIRVCYQYIYIHAYIISDWKEAIVVPMYKGGDRSLVSNYTPVSLSSVISKQMKHDIALYLREIWEKKDWIF